MHYMLNMKNMYWPYHEKHKVTKMVHTLNTNTTSGHKITKFSNQIHFKRIHSSNTFVHSCTKSNQAFAW